MTELCLTSDEIKELTAKVRPSAQIKELRRLKIEASLRGNNTVLVYRSALPVRAATRTQLKQHTPNLDAIAAPG